MPWFHPPIDRKLTHVRFSPYLFFFGGGGSFDRAGDGTGSRIAGELDSTGFGCGGGVTGFPGGGGSFREGGIAAEDPDDG